MKKYIIILLMFLFTVTGCSNTFSTPTKKVEEFLAKYQKIDRDIVEELDDIVEKDKYMDKEQKKEYKTLLEKQYQNLSYKIKNEIIKKDTATVDVEIEVLDYQTIIYKTKRYFLEHQEEYIQEHLEEKDLDQNKDYIDYKIKELRTVNDKTKYELTFTLNKEDGKWIIEKLSDEDIKKIHGLY